MLAALFKKPCKQRACDALTDDNKICFSLKKLGLLSGECYQCDPDLVFGLMAIL